MNKKILMVGLSILFILGGVLLYFIQEKDDSSPFTFTSTDWYNRYGVASKDPLGLYFFSTMLKSELQPKSVVELTKESEFDSIAKDNKKTLFVMVGDTITLAPSQYKTLLGRVKDTGDGLIMFSSTTYHWGMDSLNVSGDIGYTYNNEIHLNGQGKSFTLHHLFQADTIYARTFGIEHSNLPPLFKGDGLTIESIFNHGKGKVLLGFCPRTLVNYQFKNPDGRNHAQQLLSHLPSYERICFVSYANLQWQDSYGWEIISEDEEQSTLKLITDNRPLKHAVIALLIGLFLLVLFSAKRRRAIIPLPDAPSNLTKNYIHTVASIYQSHESPAVAYQLVKNQFYHAIQRSFYTDLTKFPIDDQCRILLEKTDQDETTIMTMLKALSQPIEQVDMAQVYYSAGLTHRFLSQTGVLKTTQNPKQFPIQLHRNLTISFIAILAGFVLFFYGFYGAAKAQAIGPGVAVIGALIFAFGLIRFRMPYLLITDVNSAFYVPLIGAKMPIELMYSAENNDIELNTLDKKPIEIPRWDRSQKEYNDLIHFIKTTHYGRTNN